MRQWPAGPMFMRVGGIWQGRPFRPQHLEEVQRLPPAKPCRNEDALLQRQGERVRARSFERQVVALHIRVAPLNRFS